MVFHAAVTSFLVGLLDGPNRHVSMDTTEEGRIESWRCVPVWFMRVIGMRTPDWRRVVFSEGVLAEPIADDNRLAVWLPEGSDGAFEYWQRVAAVAGAEVVVAQRVCAMAATAIHARRKAGGVLVKLLERLRAARSDRSFVLPDGALVEQCGNKESDLILVWPKEETSALDEAQIRAQWPEAKACRKIGDNLFVVSGIARKRPQKEPEPDTTQGSSYEVAEQKLAMARRSGDPRRIAGALTDHGILALERSNPPRAIELFEEAEKLASQVGDRLRECDALGNLGLALLATGQGEPGRTAIERELAYAREKGDRFAEKVALEHLGHAWTNLGDPARSLAAHDEALSLARSLGDRHHEAKLLWYIAIQYADQGLRDQAIASARSSVETFASLRRPEAAWYEDHLRRYEGGGAAARLGGAAAGPAGAAATFYGGSIDAGAVVQPAPTAPAATGPGLLRMAVSATQAMAKFMASGMRTVPNSTYQQRIQTCAACEHHTGLRCRICGCFTAAKARMVHENCPLGKWPLFVDVRESR
jgi:tetratricopeptide (TPR) repeat protein